MSICQKCSLEFVFDQWDLGFYEKMKVSEPSFCPKCRQQLRNKFCARCWTVANSLYCNECDNSSDLFGCIGLRHKEYCILNKQYSKVEYEKLLMQIIEKMKEDEEYGEFFPAEISPFSYQESAACSD